MALSHNATAWAAAVVARNNVQISGPLDAPVLVFAHGFGCDQTMYSRLLPYFESRFRIVLFDHVGSGGSSLAHYDAVKYATIDRYVDDLIELCAALEFSDVTLIAHSFSAMLAIAAAVKSPELFRGLVLLAPTPSYIDDADTGYEGGFTREDIDGLLESLDDNHLAWAAMMAPVVMKNPMEPQLTDELEQSFCRVDPRVMRTFARVAFLTDVRPLLPRVEVPALILQCTNDSLAPLHVGDYMKAHMPDSTVDVLDAEGHVPHVSAPAETSHAILQFLAER
ncbi:alpha/beta fold hydrolase [Agreia bicolorata]|uniref:alpha/beta fold hydrolase n=1 Tax=Agreia bicolorata TaxID=110935 RepID=UPI0005C879F1|nr:alpha/beta hydrolase [Agreia bicolorata]